MLELEQRGAVKLHALLRRKRLDQHAARDLNPDRLIRAIVEQEVERRLVEEAARRPAAAAKSRQRPDRCAPVQRRCGRPARDDNAANGDRSSIGDVRSSAMRTQPAPRDQPVQAARETHGDRPPGRRQRRRRARGRRRDAEIVGRDRQHPPRRQPRGRRRRRRRREADAARERDPARQRAARPHQRRRLLAVVILRPPRESLRQPRDRGLDARAQPAPTPPPRESPPLDRAWCCPVPSRPRCDRCWSP